MEIKISLDEYADVPFIKKLLSQIKGVKNVEITEDDKTYSWEEIENSDEFKQLIEQSRNQIKNGEYEEFLPADEDKMEALSKIVEERFEAMEDEDDEDDEDDDEEEKK